MDTKSDSIEHYEKIYQRKNAIKYLETKEKEEGLETSVKLDVARAYIAAEDTKSAVDTLNDIIVEGRACKLNCVTTHC